MCDYLWQIHKRLNVWEKAMNVAKPSSNDASVQEGGEAIVMSAVNKYITVFRKVNRQGLGNHVGI